MQGICEITISSQGQFNYPRGIALTPDDAFLLVINYGSRPVAVLRASDGTWIRQLTGPPGTLTNPIGVAVVPSTGQVLVVDYSRCLVVQFRSVEDNNSIETLGTGWGSGPTQCNRPYGLAVLDGPGCPPVRYQFFAETWRVASVNKFLC